MYVCVLVKFPENFKYVLIDVRYIIISNILLAVQEC